MHQFVQRHLVSTLLNEPRDGPVIVWTCLVLAEAMQLANDLALVLVDVELLTQYLLS